jgi:hypothetical protein
MNIQWADIMKALSSPIELQTGKQKKWFRASVESECIVINNASNHLHSCVLSAPRAIREKEYTLIVPYYLRWAGGEPGVRILAQEQSRNTTYLFALMDYL